MDNNTRTPRRLPPQSRLGRQAIAERRGHTRHAASVSTEVVELRALTRLSGRATDLGLQGCYIDTINPFPVGTDVRIQMASQTRSFQCKARVVYATPGMGMGLRFTEIASDQLGSLQSWIAELGGQVTPSTTAPFGLEFLPQENATTLDVTSTAAAENESGMQALVEDLIAILARKHMLTESEAAQLRKHLSD